MTKTSSLYNIVNVVLCLLLVAAACVGLYVVFGVFFTVRSIVAGPVDHHGRWADYASGLSYQGTRPRVSPNGKSIAFSNPAIGHGDVYRFDIDNNTLSQLTSGAVCEAEPAWSSNSEMIAYCREEGTNSHVWMMKADGTNQRQLTMGSVFDSCPAFLPDGSRIVFSRDRILGRGASAGLAIVDVSTLNVEVLRTGVEPLWGPSVTMDGTAVFAMSYDRIIRIDLATRHTRDVAAGFYPYCAADGRVLFSADGDSGTESEIFSADIGPKAVSIRRLTFEKARLLEPSSSKDGTMFFLKDIDTRGIGPICRWNQTTKEATELIDSGPAALKMD